MLTKRPIPMYGEGIDKGAVDIAAVRMKRLAPEPVIGGIETGIPVPSRPGRVAGELRRAVEELQPGQSRLFEKVEPKALYHSAKQARLKTGGEYAVRRTDDGVRVWRLS